MTIDHEHPGIVLLRESPWECHLVGSRLVGVFDRDSDYDFLIVADHLHNGLYTWLKNSGFEPDNESYGKDKRTLSSDIWTQKWEGWPKIDLIPVDPAEAEFRMRFFHAMKESGDRVGGLLARALKTGKVWPMLWTVLGTMLKGADEDG